jgi:phage regulator Rha-like protein
MENDKIVPVEIIARKILVVREQKVMLDSDLAELYEIETKTLKRAVKRNIDRFPFDFMFELSKEEYDSLRYHFGTLKKGEHSKYLPCVFTEQGVAMLSSVLRNKKAVQVNIAIMRTFVELRTFLATQKDVKIELVEHRRILQKQSSQIQSIFEAIEQMMKPPEKPKRSIGFYVEEPRVKYGVKK